MVNKNLRYRLIMEMFGSRKLLKAIAMSLFVRKLTNTNIVKNLTLNKLSSITGMHPYTIRKRLETLEEYGLVSYSGKNLTFRSLVSRHKTRNVRIAKIAYSKIKDVERSLQAILVANVQLRKDFVKRTIRKAHDGHSFKEVKSAQRIARRYKWAKEYVEYGLSYKKIAKTLNCCKATATKIVKFAVDRTLLKKFTHRERVFLPGVNFEQLKNFTFTTRHYGYIVKANTYTVAPCLSPNHGW